jgi:hypothetical protein
MKKLIGAVALCVMIGLVGCEQGADKGMAQAEQKEAAKKIEPVVVDDGDPGFETEGDWSMGWTSADYQGGLKWTYMSSTPTAKAIWTPDLPQAGKYEVYEWHGADPHYDHATDAPYTVNYDGGSKTVMVNQRKNAGQWNKLGTFEFEEGTSGNVTLTNKANGNVVADAVKFVYTGQ